LAEREKERERERERELEWGTRRTWWFLEGEEEQEDEAIRAIEQSPVAT